MARLMLYKPGAVPGVVSRMANALFYQRFINTKRLKTKLIGARRYTTDQWVRECLSEIADETDEAA